MKLPGGAECELGVGARAWGGRVVACDVHAITPGEPIHAGPHRFNVARSVGSGDIWQRWLQHVGSRPDVGVHRVDTGGSNADQDLTGVWRQSRDVFKSKHFWTAECADQNRAHEIECYHEISCPL